jgi:dyslexia-associated protein KIAA0319-like protein
VEIVSYFWERTSESLAYGTIINNSSFSPILQITNLITGRYLFKLTVTDGQGLSSSETASVIVKPPKDVLNYVEISINADIKSFTYDQQLNVLKKLELFLDKGEEIKINLIKLDATTHTQRLVIILL